jgi:hypothetical protein
MVGRLEGADKGDRGSDQHRPGPADCSDLAIVPTLTLDSPQVERIPAVEVGNNPSPSLWARDRRNVRSTGRDRRGVLVSVRMLGQEDIQLCMDSLVRFALSARHIAAGLDPLDNVSSPTGKRASQTLDCSDLTSRKLPFRKGICDDVGTIARSEQSAIELIRTFGLDRSAATLIRWSCHPLDLGECEPTDRPPEPRRWQTLAWRNSDPSTPWATACAQHVSRTAWARKAPPHKRLPTFQDH